MPDEDTARSPDTEPRAVSRPEAELLDRIAELAHCELDTAELTVAGGDTVRIVCLAEVEEWIRGLAVRARGGTHL